ncbi:fas apoptotic inhibitory molecule 1 isoform X2 [Motacilla alba alba]|uniref:fas apoptotic inhibitory molecule 1 isoform X2 n=1 Tax=Motacilla alba alba TaxID=1094192 RepID=UPI0018D58512|nr:fas apoptotic inhibitory molecule 1 isoform X2 [Motacilla alba alba]
MARAVGRERGRSQAPEPLGRERSGGSGGRGGRGAALRGRRHFAAREARGGDRAEEEIRREWMFKLVGKETFTVGATKTKAAINIDAVSGFAYEYTLEINGKSLKQYIENRLKTTNTWILSLGGTDYRIVLEKDTMDVWCNGQKMETAGEFVEDGTETHFTVADHSCGIKAVSSGKRKEGIIHTLIVDNREIPEAVE